MNYKNLVVHSAYSKFTSFISRKSVSRTASATIAMVVIFSFVFGPFAPLAGLIDTNQAKAAGGDGTLGSPYIIETAGEFAAIANYPNGANGLYFRLANDITLSNTYESIPEFSGTLDGAGRTINGVEVTLFKELNGADIRNLVVEGDIVVVNDLDNYAAAILALLVGESLIENVSVSGSIAMVGFEPGGCSEIGGLVGYSADNTYNHVTANVAIEAPDCDSVGGLIGYSQSEKISNATATGTVSGFYGVGGLIGRTLGGSSPGDDTGIFGAEATGTVSGEDDVGGLIGENVRTHVTGATARGAVTGNDNVGGLIGSVNSDSFRYQEISRVRALGAVTGEDNVGGLIGRASTNQNTGILLYIAYADNDVSGANNVGGLIGYTNSASYLDNSSWFLIEDTYSWGNVAASGSNAGGLIGSMTSWGTEEAITGIANSYAWNKGGGTGVTAQANAGGLVGRIASPETWPPEDPYISEAYRLYGSFAQTPISASGDTAGGIVGALETGGDEFSPGTDEWKNYFNAHTGDLDCDPGLKFSCEMVYDSTYFFNSQLDEPMSNWDFEGIWLVQTNTPPVFQAQFDDAGFGPEEIESEDITVNTGSATNITQTSVTLGAEALLANDYDHTYLYPNGEYYWHPGFLINDNATVNYDNAINGNGYDSYTQVDGSDTHVSYTVDFDGLDCGTQYWYRAVTHSEEGVFASQTNTFTTLACDGELVVSNFSPAHEANNVPVNTNTLSFTFSKPMTLDLATAYLNIYANDEEVQEFWAENNTVTISEDGLIVTFHLEESLQPNTRYYVEIDSDFAYVTANSNEVFGDEMNNTFWSFTTASVSGGGSSSGSSSSSSSGGRVGNRTTAQSPTNIDALINQYRSLFVQAHNNGILLPSGLLAMLGISSSTPGLCPRFTFTRDLQFGSEGEDVRALQRFLNCAGFSLGVSGPGAAGEETPYFVERTRASLIRFQEAYLAEVLTPINATVGTGIFSVYTRAKVHSLMAD